MKTAGIIAEYNPFHNGHKFHIEETKRLTGADYTVIVMSGDFVQRGEPACFDKFTRAEMALAEGADLVLELPVLYASASAEDFARGAVSVLHGLGCIDILSFGSEERDITALLKAAALLSDETEEFRTHLGQKLKEGYNFPSARSQALSDCFPEFPADALTKPNNILALEYLRALDYFSSGIQPFHVEREDNYHSSSLNGQFYSATALRGFLADHPVSETLDLFSPNAASVLRNRNPRFMTADTFSGALGYRLLSLRNGDFCAFLDVSEELKNRILKELTHYASYSDFAEALKTKQYTRTRINRALAHILLNIRKEDMLRMKEASYPAYARILGFRKASAPLLSEIKKKSAIPVITKMADADKLLNDSQSFLLSQDVFAADLYETTKATVTGKFSPVNEFNHGLIIL